MAFYNITMCVRACLCVCVSVYIIFLGQLILELGDKTFAALPLSTNSMADFWTHSTHIFGP